MNKIKNGDITLQNLPRESYRDLVEWYNKVVSNGLNVQTLGGDICGGIKTSSDKSNY